MKKFLDLNKVNVKGKKVLLRVDLNSGICNGKVLDSPRFKEHAKTINELKKRKAKVIILAHQGRPSKSDFLGLKQHARILNKYTKIKFVQDIIGKKAIRMINGLKPGEALLLDNVRKLKSEFTPGVKNKFVETLSGLSDIYVQDALSVCHRKQTSIVSFPKKMPAYVGNVLRGELKALSKMKNPKKPIVYVLGGVKVKDYLGLIKKAKKEKSKVLGNGLLKSKGVIPPLDYVGNFQDIGPKTIKEYSKTLKNVRTIFMKGAMGKIEIKKFQKGTLSMLKAIASNKKAFKLIGGGSLVTLIKEARINTKEFSYISLSGGALIKYLAGEKLPGLEVLKLSFSKSSPKNQRFFGSKKLQVSKGNQKKRRRVNA